MSFVLAMLVAACDFAIKFDPTVRAMCEAHSNDVLAFRWPGGRSVLPLDRPLTLEEDRVWRGALRLPPRSPGPSMLTHRISAVERFQDGWLVGTNQGEWGGALYFVRQGDTPREIARGNVAALIADDADILAFFGLSHLGLDEGHWRLVSGTSDGPQVGAETPLPGAPSDFARGTNIVFVAGGFDGNGNRTWARAFPSEAIEGEISVSLPCN